MTRYKMKKIVLVAIAMIISVTVVFAQNNQQKAAEEPIFKPTFIVGDIYVVFTILESIDIKGNEVEPFLETKNTISTYLQDAQNKNLKVTDKVTANMPAYIAQNLITFLSRATLKGSMAEAYKRFIDAIIESSKVQTK